MREPDFIIGDNYLRRWYIIPRNRWCNIYLHHICKSDDNRALHDHPYINMSIVLRGAYIEVMPDKVRWRTAGSVVFRRAVALHRLHIRKGESVWSLFITGPRIRQWGFKCPQGWIPWHQFVDPDNPGQPGRGCGE